MNSENGRIILTPDSTVEVVKAESLEGSVRSRYEGDHAGEFAVAVLANGWRGNFPETDVLITGVSEVLAGLVAQSVGYLLEAEGGFDLVEILTGAELKLSTNPSTRAGDAV